jgi:hypothetical protein
LGFPTIPLNLHEGAQKVKGLGTDGIQGNGFPRMFGGCTEMTGSNGPLGKLNL